MAQELANPAVIGEGLGQAVRYELLEALGFVQAKLGKIVFDPAYHTSRWSQPTPENFVKVGLAQGKRKVA